MKALSLILAVTVVLAVPACPMAEAAPPPPPAAAAAASVPVDPEVKALVEMAAQGKTEMLLKLLGPQTDVNRADASGTTPLHAAAKAGHRDIVLALLDHHADLNAKDKRGATPLLSAVAGNQPEIVRLLLDRGADPNIVGTLGGTALDDARGNAAISALLKQHGARATGPQAGPGH